MARGFDCNIPGGTFHVMNRGIRKWLIFEDDRDRKRFTRLLIQAAARYHVEILIAEQMGTHFHLVVTTPNGNLSEFMQQLEGEFARYSNWRYGRVGHLFQGPFRCVVIENDVHLFIAASYVFDNPLEAGFVCRREDWKWSTYSATVGLAPLPAYLSIGWVETLFPADSLASSQAILRRCLDEPEQVLAYLESVDPTAARAARCYITEGRKALAQPNTYRTLTRLPLEQLFEPGQSRSERANAIQVAHEAHGYKLAEYKLAEIATCLGLHPTAVSKIYCGHRQSLNSD
jgi:putative transposase